MATPKQYLLTGSLLEQQKYKTLSRVPCIIFNEIRYSESNKRWCRGYWGDDFLSAREAEQHAAKYNIEIDLNKNCFYLPVGTIVYLPKNSYGRGLYLKGYKKDNPKIGVFHCRVSYTNRELFEVEDYYG